MKIILKLCLLISLASTQAMAMAEQKSFKGLDLSGEYTCTGEDQKDGKFEATMTLTLDKEHSNETFAGYKFQLKAHDGTLYSGSATGNSANLAITFNNNDVSKKDFGTGIGKVVKNKSGKIQIEKFYYEPEYKGGDHGTEICVRTKIS